MRGDKSFNRLYSARMWRRVAYWNSARTAVDQVFRESYSRVMLELWTEKFKAQRYLEKFSQGRYFLECTRGSGRRRFVRAAGSGGPHACDLDRGATGTQDFDQKTVDHQAGARFGDVLQIFDDQAIERA